MNKAEQMIWDEIDNAGGMDEVDRAVDLIEAYMYHNTYHTSKRERINNWLDSMPELYELVVGIFTTVLIYKELTYQAAIGLLHHKIDLPENRDRIAVIAEVIALIDNAGLINITRHGSGKSIMITPGFTSDNELPEPDSWQISYDRPQPIEKNNHIEYGSMLLGNSDNYHDKYICLSHLNRLNQIPLKLNTVFLNSFIEQAPKELDTVQKQEQWEKFKIDSNMKYAETIHKHNNKFYLLHKYDVRGRSYCCGYHITTQGTKYKKAMIELYEPEIVNRSL